MLISAGLESFAGANVPVALRGVELHHRDRGAPLLAVPEAAGEFTVLGEGSSGRERVRINTPDGSLRHRQSGGGDFAAPVTLAPGPHAEESWSTDARPDEGSSRQCSLSGRRPGLAGAEHVFGVR